MFSDIPKRTRQACAAALAALTALALSVALTAPTTIAIVGDELSGL